MRLIGVLQGLTADDAQGKVRFAAFQQELLQLGWTDGHNVRFNHRWGEGQCRPHASTSGRASGARARRHSDYRRAEHGADG
jgi:hypothetical protein